MTRCLRGRARKPSFVPGRDELDALLDNVRACRVCVDHPRGAALPHEPRPIVRGRVTARIAVCGQAPGIRVHRSGLPFDDPSGDRLRGWMGVTRADFYDEDRVAVVPMGFCFPGYDRSGGDLPPRPECAPLWRNRVLAEFSNLSLMLVIGSYAMAWHLPMPARQSMTQTVRGWYEISGRSGDGPSLLPLPHPSWRNSGWLKANPWFDAEVVPALRVRVATLLR